MSMQGCPQSSPSPDLPQRSSDKPPAPSRNLYCRDCLCKGTTLRFSHGSNCPEQSAVMLDKENQLGRGTVDRGVVAKASSWGLTRAGSRRGICGEQQVHQRDG